MKKIIYVVVVRCCLWIDKTENKMEFVDVDTLYSYDNLAAAISIKNDFLINNCYFGPEILTYPYIDCRTEEVEE